MLVPPTPQDLAAGLRRLVEDPALRVSLGAAARAKAEREYSPHTFRTRLLAAYERVLMATMGALAFDTEMLQQLLAL